MPYSFSQAVQIHAPDMKYLVATTATMVLTVVIKYADRIAYIEFSPDVPMANVIAAIQTAEDQGVVFDLLDTDLWEDREACTRIHGMFIDDLR